MVGWGIAYVPSAWLVEEWPPLVSAGARFGLAGLLLAAGLMCAGQSLRPRVGAGVIVWVALTQTALFYGAVFWGIAHAGVGLSAVLSNTDPLFIAVLAALALGESLSGRQWLGITIGFIGAAVVAWEGSLWPPMVSLDAVIVLGGALAWSVGTLTVVRSVRGRAAPLALAAWQMLLGGAVLMGVGVVTEGAPDATGRSLALVAVTALVGGAMPLALFYVALTRAPAGEVSAWFFLVPVVGVLSSWAFLGEIPGISLFFGLGTVSIGLWLVMARRVRGRGGLVDSTPLP